MTTMRLKSPASRLFTQSFIQAQIKENIKAPRHWLLCGECTGTGEIPAQRPVTRKCFHLMTSSWEGELAWCTAQLFEWICYTSFCFALLIMLPYSITVMLNERHGVSKHRQLHYLFNRLFWRTSEKTLKRALLGLCERNPSVTGRFLSWRASDAENFSNWWRHYAMNVMCLLLFTSITWLELGQSYDCIDSILVT